VIVEFRFDDERPRAWMRRVAGLVDAEQDIVQVKWVRTGAVRPAGLEALFTLERMVLRTGGGCEADAIGKQEIGEPSRDDRRPDVIVDFTGAETDAAGAPRLYLRPLFNGCAGEDAALAAILLGDLPKIEIRNEINGAILDAGQPSAEVADGLSGALATVMARTMTLLKPVMAGTPRYVRPETNVPAVGRPRSSGSFVLVGLAAAIAKRIYRLCCYAPHWHVGWRYTDDDGIWSSGNLSGHAWNIIADPGHRFYADPFPVTWKGRTFVFFEDLDHRVGKGIISAVEFDDNGPTGAVTPVLEEPWHLSYPFLLQHDGELWMIPESSGNRDVALYRCVDFPGRWERHATLLSGLELGDATIVRRDMFYLFGVTYDGFGGYSDCLSIFYSHNLLGPWLPHAANPVAVDRTCARPAGNFFEAAGKLWRPVQDCTDGYGRALGLAEIVELSPNSFRQIVRHTIKPGSRWPGRKLHTLNRTGRLEVIDGSRIQPKLAALRPLVR
jgi:hypothetical protein